MRIQVGSKVKFLNDIGGGVLKSFVGDRMALVETDDGFEISVLVTELLPASDAAYTDEDSNAGSDKKPEPAIPQKKEIEIPFEEKKYKPFKGEAFLALVPQNERILHVSNFDLYLVNTSTYHFSFCIYANDGPVLTLLKKGSVKPDTRVRIEEYSQTGIGKIKEFSLQGIFFKHGNCDKIQPVNHSFSMEGISFYKIAHFRETEYFHEKALLLIEDNSEELKEAIEKLSPEELHAVISKKEQEAEKKVHKSPKNTSIEVVDLHIEAILENTSGLSNGEIIETQLATFETALLNAIRSKVQKIVFIHGVGNGKLRQELRNRLDKKYSDLKYQDASFREYGYGATMVYLK
jgi:hypothetical protein